MVEFLVEGTPRSLQSSAAGKSAWKDIVAEAARKAMGEIERLEFVDVAVQILHFCFDWADTDGDLDNIAKPILDAASLVVFFNDNQVRQLLLRRTDLSRAGIKEIIGGSRLLNVRLSEALGGRRDGFVYVAVDTTINHGSAP